MRYRGVINFDFTNSKENEQQKLVIALRHSGWLHVETSAFVRESENINNIWEGISLVAKQASRIGILSALTFHIQASNDFTQNVQYASTRNPANALNEISELPFPAP